MSANNLGLYIHVPFCKAKCHYCDFNSFPEKEDLISGYFDAVFKEIENYSGQLKDYCIKTIFIGGGTPSLAEPKEIYGLLRRCREFLNIERNAETTIESNPGTLSYEKLLAYKSMGINRLSIGLQAWQNRLLKKLGRVHNIEEFLENYEIAKRVGLKNINIDLIFGIPSQSLKDWSETLESVISLQPAHLSCYSLKIEEETAFGKWLETGELVPLEDELDRDMYGFTIERLRENGYRHYEISNFAKEGFECRHNLVYWNAGEYIGVGAGAHSYFKGNRYNNVYNIEEYISAVKSGGNITENNEYIDSREEMTEFIILGLRLIEGISLSRFKARFNKDFASVYGDKTDKLIKRGLAEIEGDYFRLTSLGLDLANDVFIEFI